MPEPSADNTNDATTPGDAPADDSKSFVGHALVVSGLTLVSRMTGLLRDAALAALLGLGPVADAFFIGFLIPNLCRRLFGEGALTAAFLPVYSQLKNRDEAQAARLAYTCIALLLVGLGSVTIVAEIVLGAIIYSWQGSESTGLALSLTMVMLPYMPLICAAALLGAVLQVNKRFAATAAAPVILNLVMLAGIGAAVYLNPIGDGTDTASQQKQAFVVGISVVIAGVLQMLFQFLPLLKLRSLSSSFAGTKTALREIGRTMIPMLIGAGVFQLNAMLDALIAFCMSPKVGGPETITWLNNTPYPIENGAVAALQWAQRLYQFPLGVFGIAISTAIFPALAAAVVVLTKSNAETSDNTSAETRDPNSDAAKQPTAEEVEPGPDFVTTLRHGLRLTVFIGLPASVGLMLTCLPLTRLIYEHGQFNADDTLRVAAILAGYASAVWAYSTTHVLSRAFYALRDPVRPLRVTIAMVISNLVLNLILIWPFGAVGLAWSTAITATGQCLLLLWVLSYRVARPVDRGVTTSWLRTALLCTLMGAAVWLVGYAFDIDSQTGLKSAGVLALMIASGMVVYGGAAIAAGAPELKWLIKRRIG